MMANNEAGMVLQKIYSSVSESFELQMIDIYHHMNPRSIDELVEMEMKRLQAAHKAEEERFVEQKLKENPVVVERRSVTKRSETPVDERLTLIQQQRAESCRKSRINNKVKKAKSKYRHTYMSNKLAQSATTLDYIRNVIAQTEAQLLLNGYNQASIQKLRNTFGLDRCKDNSALDMTMPIENINCP